MQWPEVAPEERLATDIEEKPELVPPVERMYERFVAPLRLLGLLGCLNPWRNSQARHIEAAGVAMDIAAVGAELVRLRTSPRAFCRAIIF